MTSKAHVGPSNDSPADISALIDAVTTAVEIADVQDPGDPFSPWRRVALHLDLAIAHLTQLASETAGLRPADPAVVRQGTATIDGDHLARAGDVAEVVRQVLADTDRPTAGSVDAVDLGSAGGSPRLRDARLLLRAALDAANAAQTRHT